MIIVATDMSAVVRYFTRFTEEAFAALIGIIFVYEALKKLFSKFYMIDWVPIQMMNAIFYKWIFQKYK